MTTKDDNIRANKLKGITAKDSAKDKNMEKSLQALLDGSFLTRDRVIRLLPFLLFLTLIAVIYISNIYYAEGTQRESDHIQTELKELRYEYITAKSGLMYKSKQSEVAKNLESTDIIESTTPPVKIIIENQEERNH
jgi:hypothetical protein